MRHSDFVLKAPAPDVMLGSFAASAIVYRVRFWIEDFELDEEAATRCASRIYYAFAGRGSRFLIRSRSSTRANGRRGSAGRQAAEGMLARRRSLRLADRRAAGRDRGADVTAAFGDGEAIVRQGDPGQSMFVVASGQVAVVIEPERRDVATIDRGGYFGEMSLLTGDPRTATVVARGEAVCSRSMRTCSGSSGRPAPTPSSRSASPRRPPRRARPGEGRRHRRRGRCARDVPRPDEEVPALTIEQERGSRVLRPCQHVTSDSGLLRYPRS